MNLRVPVVHKPAPSSFPASSELPKDTQPARGYPRRRRHTPHNQQDRWLRLVSRILVILGVLMVIWLLLAGLGWV